VAALPARFAFAVDEACGHTEADDGEKVNGDDGPVDRCHMRVLGGFLEDLDMRADHDDFR
jgi:hypothetical protein